MSSTAQQSEELYNAILGAFPTQGDLVRVAHKLGQNLAAIASDGKLSDVVLNLVTWLESRNLVETWVAGAREDNPGNEELRRFEEKYSHDFGNSGSRSPTRSESPEEAFERETRRARRQIKSTIPGLSDALPRSEIEWIEEQLSRSTPVMFTGDAGTGKSAVADKLAAAAYRDGKAVLFIDARRTAYVQNDAQLQQHLGTRSTLFVQSRMSRIANDAESS